MIITPLGLPVEPLVYITTARSDGLGFTISLSTVGNRTIKISHNNFRVSTVAAIIFLNDVQNQNSSKTEGLRTVFGTLAQLLHCLHVVDGQTIWVTFCFDSTLVDVDHMLEFWNLPQHILDKTKGKHNIKEYPHGFRTM